jgi:hypothetical protein
MRSIAIGKNLRRSFLQFPIAAAIISVERMHRDHATKDGQIIECILRLVAGNHGAARIGLVLLLVSRADEPGCPKGRLANV